MAPHFRPSGLGLMERDDDYEPVLERPSILGYRQTISLRRSYYPPMTPGAKPMSSPPSTRSPNYYAKRYVSKPMANGSIINARQCAMLFGDDEETKEAESDDRSTAELSDMASTSSASSRSDSSRIPMLPMGDDMPLLEVSDDDEEQEPDVILCDPTRLTRTKIIDEDGRHVDRATMRMTQLNNSNIRSSMINSGAINEVDESLDLRMTMGMDVGRMELRPDSVIKAGLIFRQGFGFRNGGWRVRYAVLTSSHLTFYTEENGRKRGEVALSACDSTSIDIMPRDSLFDGAQATMWRFAFRAKNRRVLLAAYTETEMKEWLRCLHVVLHVQHNGFGRYTDMIVPNGTLLAQREDGQMRMSGSQVRWWHASSFSRSVSSELT